MVQTLIGHDGFRILAFAVVFTAMAVWELAAGRRDFVVGRGRRWPTNLTLLVLGIGFVRVMMPLSVVEIAALGRAHAWGVLASLSLPLEISISVSLVALDCALYLQHVAFHHISVLWRVHRVHHSDSEFDVTTGLRFHPVEFIVSTIVKVAAVLALGSPPEAVVIFEVLLNVSSMFTHGNVSLPPAVDGFVRWLFVTPDMHRIHHSSERAEHNTNFGFNLAVWDRLFQTYRQDPEGGHDRMTIGLGVDQRRAADLGVALVMPFERLPAKNRPTP